MFNKLDEMMIDIVDFGEEQVFKDIEIISDAIKRASLKGLYYEAIKKLKENDKEWGEDI